MIDTGCYVRMERDGKWVNLDIIEMTKDEFMKWVEDKQYTPQAVADLTYHLLEILRDVEVIENGNQE